MSPPILPWLKDATGPNPALVTPLIGRPSKTLIVGGLAGLMLALVIPTVVAAALLGGWTAGETLAFGELILAYCTIAAHMHLTTILLAGLALVLYTWTSTVTAILYTAATVITAVINRAGPPLS